MPTVFGMSEEDKREIIADFLSESGQHIHTLNTQLLNSEEALKIDHEIPDDQINMMFRAAHTIKGSSSMLGFENLSHLTHEMENLLDIVRAKKSPLTMQMIQVLFIAFDSLKTLLDKLRDEGNDDLDVKEVVSKIKAVLNPEALTSKPIPALPETMSDVSERNKYLPAFLDDTEGCIFHFNEILLSFEKDLFNPDQMNELFRLAHTIKGSAGVIKCKGIETVAHRIEDLLEDLREKGTKPPAKAMSFLFKGIDWIKSAVDALQKGTFQESDLSAFLKQFEVVKTTIVDPLTVLSEDINNKIRAALKARNNIFKIVILLQGKAMLDVKSVIVEERLKKTGTILTSVPNLKSISEHNADTQVNILYATPSLPDQVHSFLLLDEVKIISITREDFSHLQSFVASSEKRPPEAAAVTVETDISPKSGPMEITTMKVDSRKLDHLMNLAGELVITRARFAQLINEFNNTMSSKEVAVKVYSLGEVTSALGKLSSDIQSAVMQTRMVPIEGVFSRFRRLVRDISRELDKEINLEFYGEDTELDKKIVDALPDSLTHMIRNAIDHGIESRQERITAGKNEVGTIQLKAVHQGSSICIEIIDDGKGLDASKLAKKALEKGLVTQERLTRMSEKEKLNLIFLPGFSTSEKVTELSGRGVGMDVVKKMIDSLNGTIEIESQPGFGSRFILKIPLTLAIIQALLVIIRSQVFAIPLEDVSEVIKIGPKDIYSTDATPMIKLRGHALSLLSMAKILGMPEGEKAIDGEQKVVVVDVSGELYAIKVDSLIGEDEIVIKAFPDYFANVKGISGASILGDGKIALILDVSAILHEV